jgi:hypothetical protein
MVGSRFIVTKVVCRKLASRENGKMGLLLAHRQLAIREDELTAMQITF